MFSSFSVKNSQELQPYIISSFPAKSEESLRRMVRVFEEKNIKSSSLCSPAGSEMIWIRMGYFSAQSYILFSLSSSLGVSCVSSSSGPYATGGSFSFSSVCSFNFVLMCLWQSSNSPLWEISGVVLKKWLQSHLWPYLDNVSMLQMALQSL